MFHHYINDVATDISICWYLSFWLLQIEFLVTVAVICVLIGTHRRAYTGVSWHSLFRRSQYGRDISINRICINIISQVVHIYCIKIHICKYFYHHIWDIHMYFFIYDNLSHFIFSYIPLQAAGDRYDAEQTAEIGNKNDKCCLLCNKQFPTKKDRHDHYQIRKSSLKCTDCDKSFDKLCTFHAHENICAGLGKFKCSGCGLCLVDKKRLIIIWIIVEKNPCRRCSLPFCDWKLLLNHCKIVHPKIECKICSSFFSSKILFEQHTKRYHNT